MRSWTAHQLLGVWERGGRLHALDRTLSALVEASGPRDLDMLADLPVGELRRRALALAQTLFDGRLEGEAICPRCQERHEVRPPVDVILAAPPAKRDPVEVELEGHRVTLRAVTTRDLAALTHGACDERALLARCVVEVRRDGEPVELASLPPSLLDAVAGAAAALDPNADTMLGITCVGCGHAFELVFDPGEFLWCELSTRARQLLYQVHVLASHYGWAEHEILSMSDRRRESYLAMVDA